MNERVEETSDFPLDSIHEPAQLPIVALRYILRLELVGLVSTLTENVCRLMHKFGASFMISVQKRLFPPPTAQVAKL